MEIYEDIANFLYLLTEIPETFSPTAWEDLPSLAAEIDQLAGNESAINDTIKNGCIQRELGDALIGNLREISDPPQPLPTTL